MIEWFAKTEISQFQDTIVHEDVVRFQIAVHDVLTVQDLKCFEQLAQVVKGPLFRQGALPFEEHIESSAIAVLVDKVKVIGCFEHVDVLDDVIAALLQLREDIDFVDCALFELGDFAKLLNLDDFDGHFLMRLDVHRAIHPSVDSLPKALLERIVIDHLSHI